MGKSKESKINVQLITYTPDPELCIAMAAKLCYSSSDIQETMSKIKMTPEKTEKFIEHLIQLGHESPLEHVKYTFAIEGISRVLTHQLVRHRIASYSQQSQRYVKEHDFETIVPPSIAAKPESKKVFDELMSNIQEMYDRFLQMGIPAEDARYILPNATETKIICTFNARSLMNFFNLRCCARAQWEIRALANKMLALVKPTAPHLFGSSGAACVKLGYCPEATMSCGRYPTLESVKNINAFPSSDKEDNKE